ncbi:unnamed protein product [Nezara viridula]|uniref:Uncharacterized protein n=1 Tax=Nezara viridula TaxID=85310 RepID=A0A9P0EG88_NEZVI|nr:unnamed protein product [Nezara viridula]
MGTCPSGRQRIKFGEKSNLHRFTSSMESDQERHIQSPSEPEGKDKGKATSVNKARLKKKIYQRKEKREGYPQNEASNSHFCPGYPKAALFFWTFSAS